MVLRVRKIRKRVFELFNRKKNQSLKDSKINRSSDQHTSLCCMSFNCSNLYIPCCEIHPEDNLQKDRESIQHNDDVVHRYENNFIDSIKLLDLPTITSKLFKDDDGSDDNIFTEGNLFIEGDEIFLSFIIQHPQIIDNTDLLRIESSPISVPVEILTSELPAPQLLHDMDVFESNSEAILSPSKKRVKAIGIDLYKYGDHHNFVVSNISDRRSASYINECKNNHLLTTISDSLTISEQYYDNMDKPTSILSTIIQPVLDIHNTNNEIIQKTSHTVWYKLNTSKQCIRQNIIPLLKTIFLIMILIYTVTVLPYSIVQRKNSNIYENMSHFNDDSKNISITPYYVVMNNHNNYTSEVSDDKQYESQNSLLALKHIKHHIILQLVPTNPIKTYQQQYPPQQLPINEIATHNNNHHYNNNNNNNDDDDIINSTKTHHKHNKYNILTNIKETLGIKFIKHNIKQKLAKIILKFKSYTQNLNIKKLVKYIKRYLQSSDFIKLAEYLLYINKKIDEAYLKAWY